MGKESLQQRVVNNTSSSNRILYFDIAKGVLILLLMFSHFGSATRRIGIENEWFKLIFYWQPLYACFFMQCFFIISGYCSNFTANFISFIKKQSKQILIPWFCFELINKMFVILNDFSFENILYRILTPPNTGLWFFSALFFAKIFCYVVINYVKFRGVLLSSGLLLLLAALVMNQYNLLPNVLAFQNGLAACFFVSLGYVMKQKGFSNKILKFGLVIYVCCILGLKLLKLPFPILDAGVSNVGWVFLPIILVMTISGSFACLLVCKWINHCRFLEYFGRNSIIVYALHFTPLLYIVKFYTTYIIPDGVFSMLLLTFLIYGTLLIVLYFLVELFNTKYFKWVIGR